MAVEERRADDEGYGHEIEGQKPVAEADRAFRTPEVQLA
jgi:hypothetical protein